jgi:ribosomal protein S18 acetylase RimI-like enzyme
MGWSFDLASESDIDDLMAWFPDAHSVDIWGGPRFRYPFDRESFHADCRADEYSSYCLRNPAGDFAAFGQMGVRYGRSHMARLVANPDMRGQGIGRTLLEKMIAVARMEPDVEEMALFVYKDNEPAYRCYLALGFRVQDYPDAAALRDKCFYMTRPANQSG